ncbi:UvrD-helicase domain-containing protein [Moorena sp. SIO3I6]|uniref:UvrD-helicase domain-containing protein n=1 Tax=Moorena sp. SIO3I6 TaxID=2607831 RepID=UPI0013F859E7|nr:UvrD-helicase domain-containing protein [Moorena sp. SIO3I6]NEP23974.1 UvrD-helicase domain-containing protein [Moorena sp. SIO3I6]
MSEDTDTKSGSQQTPLAAWRAQELQRLRNSLRRGQQPMADWQGGTLAVSAVPGAGKSTGMAKAAAIAIANYQLHSRYQLLVVTFTRSAAASIRAKIRDDLKTLKVPQNSFVVYTLHGLALYIANRHPELSGLNLDSSTLVTPNQSHRLIRACVEQWIANYPRRYLTLLEGRSFDGEETERLRRQSVLRTEVLPNLAYTVIHEAKSSGLLPADLWHLSEQTTDEYGILAIAAGLYQQYQTIVRSREFIDYDDMILAALRVLQNDAIRQLWQNQFFAVFEDEAQDSTPLQYRLLQTLATFPASSEPNLEPWPIGHATRTTSQPSTSQPSTSQPSTSQPSTSQPSTSQPSTSQPSTSQPSTSQPNQPWPIGHATRTTPHHTLNLIRVGDPNQAINSTFTPADPIYFNWFCQKCQGIGRLATMDQAGRSSQVIIDAANFIVNWVNSTYGSKNSTETVPQPDSIPQTQPSTELPFRPQTIRRVDANDPQPDANPNPEGRGLELYTPKDIYHTVELIGKRVVELFAKNQNHNAAVLVRENRQGTFVVEQLEYLKRQHGIEVYDVQKRDRESHVPSQILTLLQFLDRPHSPDYLKAALDVLVKRQLIPTQDLNALSTYPEQFLYPGPLDPPQTKAVIKARRYCCDLLRARLELPNYHLISFLAQTLNYDQSELATADKLAERIAKQTFGNSSISETLTVLQEIVSSERFEPVDPDNTESPYLRSHQLTVITMHKAKGLDWDYVFLPFLHEDTLPGNPWVPTAAQFLGEFTLAEVARAQIRAYLHGKPLPMAPEAWEQAAQLKTAEEFRLLYVAMTRAKRLLWMAAADLGPFRWNTFSGKGDNLQQKKPCPVLPALKAQFPNSLMVNDYSGWQFN